jgi:preprotein translocase subunit YajC
MTLAFLQQAASPAGPYQGLASFLPIILVFVIFYFVLLAPMRKQQKRTKEMLAALKKGDRVLTSGGIFGTVAHVEGQAVWVKIADTVKVKMAKSGITAVVEDGETSKDPAG